MVCIPVALPVCIAEPIRCTLSSRIIALIESVCIKNLTASYTACAVECTTKCLSTDTYKNGSKLSSDLMLLVSRENVDDTVDS